MDLVPLVPLFREAFGAEQRGVLLSESESDLWFNPLPQRVTEQITVSERRPTLKSLHSTVSKRLSDNHTGRIRHFKHSGGNRLEELQAKSSQEASTARTRTRDAR
ncbi:hypothetical protein SRHO_G00303630 [Serrasalmus rhombeus]